MRKSKSSLINRSAVKKYILNKFAEDRPHLNFTRVSEAALLLLEAKIQNMLDSDGYYIIANITWNYFWYNVLDVIFFLTFTVKYGIM